MNTDKITLTFDRDVAERMQKFLSAFVEEDNQVVSDIDSFQFNLAEAIHNKNQENVIPNLSIGYIDSMKPGEDMDLLIHKLLFPTTWRESLQYAFSLESKSDWTLLLREFYENCENIRFSLEITAEGNYLCRCNNKAYSENSFYLITECITPSEAVCKLFIKYKMTQQNDKH